MPVNLPFERYLNSDYASFFEGDTGIPNFVLGVGDKLEGNLKNLPVLSFMILPSNLDYCWSGWSSVSPITLPSRHHSFVITDFLL